MGGVGNQLFQISRAATRKAHGEKVELLSLARYQSMVCRFTGWSNHENWIDIKNLSDQIGINSREVTLWELVFLVHAFLLRKFGLTSFFDREYFGNYNSTKKMANIIDAGYFQTKKHVSQDSIKLVSDALIRTLGIGKKSTKQAVVIHIRGGDFNDLQRLKKSDMKYIVEFAEEHSLQIEIVTNDQVFAASLFDDDSVISFYEGGSAKDDFKYLSSASNLFISDSTFSLWAALCSRRHSSSSIFGPSKFLFKDFLALDFVNTQS